MQKYAFFADFSYLSAYKHKRTSPLPRGLDLVRLVYSASLILYLPEYAEYMIRGCGEADARILRKKSTVQEVVFLHRIFIYYVGNYDI